MKHTYITLLTAMVLYAGSGSGLHGQDVLTGHELLKIRSLSGLAIHPDGSAILYRELTPRGPNDPPGPSRSHYKHRVPGDPSATSLFPDTIDGKSPAFSPDGSMIGFLWNGGEGPDQVWAMDASGENVRQLTRADGGVTSFRWQPGRQGLGFLSPTPESEREKELERRGYGFIYYEENLKNRNLHLASFDGDWNPVETRQLTEGVQVWDFEFDATGEQIAASISPENLIDHRYMFRKIYLVDPATGSRQQVSRNEGKLGNYVFSPDGRKLAYAAALHLNDHAVSQAYVTDLASGEVTHLTPEGFRGHVEWVHWYDDENILTYTGEGVYPRLSRVPVSGGEREVLLDSRETGMVFNEPVVSRDGKRFAFTASTPYRPGNLYIWDGKKEPKKLTDLNPWIAGKTLGKQEVIRYNARDGLEIEGLLIHPVGYEEGNSYPLVVYVHGGPESHHNNDWLSGYSRPGQVMAGKGYLVLYLNYRASTGYGVEFAMEGFMDAAGQEFDDIADGIEWVVANRGADPDRVGLAGGSYGGFASAWFATYYTRYVKAVCMFVGISNNISKRGTTDIAYEELYVHSGRPLEEMWQEALERSPIYWAHQSQTATLIYGGAADTRVHPSQSLELYRRMKMNNHPAVRLVQYPGEGHGNRNQVGRIDVLFRQMAWFDWYVRDLNPLDGPMPPLDVSDRYGLDWDH